MENNDFIAYIDFAHAPSKVKATLSALREKYPERKLVAFLELHTFSSLNKNFLPQYAHSMKDADIAHVYFNSNVLKSKKLEELTEQDIKNAFSCEDIDVINNDHNLSEKILGIKKKNAVVIFMSSGNFSGINIKSFINTF